MRQGCKIRLRLIEITEDSLGVLDEIAADRGWRHASCRSVEQANIEQSFDLAEPTRNRGLRRTHDFSGTTQA